MNDHCVYAHLKPTGEVFYVGKATISNGRTTYFKRNVYYNRVVEKYGPPTVQILASSLTEQEAFNFEKLMIKKLREEGVELTNMTAGGDGLSSESWTTEMKQKQSSTISGLMTEDYRKQISETNTKVMSRPGMREKISSTTRLGMLNPEVQEKMRLARLGRTLTESHKISLAKAQQKRRERERLARILGALNE